MTYNDDMTHDSNDLLFGDRTARVLGCWPCGWVVGFVVETEDGPIEGTRSCGAPATPMCGGNCWRCEAGHEHHHYYLCAEAPEQARDDERRAREEEATR